ncbi:MAG: GNAT family N-acetyltransferase [Alphaproteobacteria bacterium]|jgi:GNAT superfamily N-acetyltransferase
MAELPEGFLIRKATDLDHDALSDICLKTGDSGKDGTHLQDDPALLGLVYAIPYQVFTPDFAFVLEDAKGVCGYVLGVPDTTAFEDWMDKSWYPPLRAQMCNPGPDANLWRQSDWVRWRIFAPRRQPPVDLSLYPAHGHIDLLPRAVGKRLGRAMMNTLTAALSGAGVPGMFLEVGPANTSAQGFYAHIGFRMLGRLPDCVVMGRTLGKGAEP